MSAFGFSVIARHRSDGSTCRLHWWVHRNGGQLLLMVPNRHVHLHVHQARAREPLQNSVVQPCSPHREAHMNQTRWVDGHHGWVVPFGGDGGGALMARARGTCDRFYPFDVPNAITFDVLELYAPNLVCSRRQLGRCDSAGQWGREPARAHVHTAFLYIRNGWTDHVETWCTDGDHLVRWLPKLSGGVTLHVRTCRVAHMCTCAPHF